MAIETYHKDDIQSSQACNGRKISRKIKYQVFFLYCNNLYKMK